MHYDEHFDCRRLNSFQCISHFLHFAHNFSRKKFPFCNTLRTEINQLIILFKIFYLIFESCVHFSNTRTECSSTFNECISFCTHFGRFVLDFFFFLDFVSFALIHTIINSINSKNELCQQGKKFNSRKVTISKPEFCY